MTNQLLTDEQEKVIVGHIKRWLGLEGILHFQSIKDVHGSVDTVWAEFSVLDSIPQYVTRCTNTQEGVNLRTFMKTLEECKDWEESDFQNQWVPIVEECIKD